MNMLMMVLLEQILKIKKQIESLELTNNKLTENLDKNYINMLKEVLKNLKQQKEE